MYCETVSNGGLPQEPYHFNVAYDKLVIAAGAEPLTFGIKGVKEHAYFLREVNHAQEIRKKLLLNLMLSENPGNILSQLKKSCPGSMALFRFLERMKQRKMLYVFFIYQAIPFAT